MPQKATLKRLSWAYKMLQILIFTHVKDETVCEIILVKPGPKWMKITNHFQWQNSHHEQNITHTQWSSRCKKSRHTIEFGLTSRFSKFLSMPNDPYIDTLLSNFPSFSVKCSSSSSMKSVGRGYSCVSRIHVVYFFFSPNLFLSFTHFYIKYVGRACRKYQHRFSFVCRRNTMCRYTGAIQAYMTDFATSCTISQMHTRWHLSEQGKIRKATKSQLEVKTLSERIQTIKNVQGRMTPDGDKTEMKQTWTLNQTFHIQMEKYAFKHGNESSNAIDTFWALINRLLSIPS